MRQISSPGAGYFGELRPIRVMSSDFALRQPEEFMHELVNLTVGLPSALLHAACCFFLLSLVFLNREQSAVSR